MPEQISAHDELAAPVATAVEHAQEDSPKDDNATDTARRDDGGSRSKGADDTIQGWLTETHDYKAPKRGQVRQGEVLQVNEDEVVLDVG